MIYLSLELTPLLPVVTQNYFLLNIMLVGDENKEKYKQGDYCLS